MKLLLLDIISMCMLLFFCLYGLLCLAEALVEAFYSRRKPFGSCYFLFRPGGDPEQVEQEIRQVMAERAEAELVVLVEEDWPEETWTIIHRMAQDYGFAVLHTEAFFRLWEEE